MNNGLTLTNTTNPASAVDSSNPSTGMVLTHFPAAGFYVQVKFKVTNTQAGFWPAIWFPYDNGNPVNGNEIDMYEGGMIGGSCTASNTNSCMEENYGGQPSQDPSWVQHFSPAGIDITQNFVTIGLELIPGKSAKEYINGSLVLDDENGSNIGAEPNYNLEITPQNGGTAGSWHTAGSGTGSMFVSEVAVYALP